MRVKQLEKGAIKTEGYAMADMDDGASVEEIKDTILHRFRMSPDLLSKALDACGGIERFMDIVEMEAEFHEGAEELGSSDISGMVRSVMKSCGATMEGHSPHKKGTKKYKAHMAAMHAGESKVTEGVLDTDDEDGFMAKAQLYHTAKYAAELHSMIGDRDSLPGWCQAKLTKAQDYLSVVKHYLEYQMVKQQMATPEMPDVDEGLTYAIAKQAHDHHKKTGELPSHVEVDGKKMPVKMKHDAIKKIVDWVNYAQVDEDAYKWYQKILGELDMKDMKRRRLPGVDPATGPMVPPVPMDIPQRGGKPSSTDAPIPMPKPDRIPDTMPEPTEPKEPVRKQKKTLPRAIEV